MSMKLSWIGMGLAVGVSIAIGLWVAFSLPADTPDPGATGSVPAAVETPMVETQYGRATLAELLRKGENLECSFEFDSGTFQGSGTGFLVSNALRTDAFYQDEAGEIFTSSLIVAGERMYLWSTTPEGTLALSMAAPDEVSPLEEDSVLSTDGIALTDQVLYTCQPWEVDPAVFTPPALDFIDVDAMMQNLE